MQNELTSPAHLGILGTVVYFIGKELRLVTKKVFRANNGNGGFPTDKKEAEHERRQSDIAIAKIGANVETLVDGQVRIEDRMEKFMDSTMSHFGQLGERIAAVESRCKSLYPDSR